VSMSAQFLIVCRVKFIHMFVECNMFEYLVLLYVCPLNVYVFLFLVSMGVVNHSSLVWETENCKDVFVVCV